MSESRLIVNAHRTGTTVLECALPSGTASYSDLRDGDTRAPGVSNFGMYQEQMR
ncbi:MAG: hypothetical protein M3Y72_26355 [Acidobacteriota bacterium]|nr:hypothetical protein [Acidobacteriota bacterium]MDQ2844506.1 hypothetical protein [Acidobacteriota bacterium]